MLIMLMCFAHYDDNVDIGDIDVAFYRPPSLPLKLLIKAAYRTIPEKRALHFF